MIALLNPEYFNLWCIQWISLLYLQNCFHYNLNASITVLKLWCMLDRFIVNKIFLLRRCKLWDCTSLSCKVYASKQQMRFHLMNRKQKLKDVVLFSDEFVREDFCTFLHISSRFLLWLIKEIDFVFLFLVKVYLKNPLLPINF